MFALGIGHILYDLVNAAMGIPLIAVLICWAGLIATTDLDIGSQHSLAKEVKAYLGEADYMKLDGYLLRWIGLPAHDKYLVLDLLASHLSSSEHVGLNNPFRLEIPYRIKTGDLHRWNRDEESTRTCSSWAARRLGLLRRFSVWI